MAEEYDALAEIIRTERCKSQFHDPATPYPGIEWLWDADAFPTHRPNIEVSERAGLYVLPGNPDVLIRAGTVQIADRGYRVNADESVSAEEAEVAQRYLGDSAIAHAYSVVSDVLAKKPLY